MFLCTVVCFANKSLVCLTVGVRSLLIASVADDLMLCLTCADQGVIQEDNVGSVNRLNEAKEHLGRIYLISAVSEQ